VIPAALKRRIPDTVDRVLYMEFPANATPDHIARVTLKHINVLIREGAQDALVRQVTDQVLADANARASEPLSVIQAVHNWVQQRIRYEYDPDGIEMLTGARQAIAAALKNGRYSEDCDGMVIVEASMLGYALGRSNVRTTIIKANKRSPKQWSHIYLQARANGQWINLDPIMNGEHSKRPKKPVGWEAPDVFARRREGIGAGPGLDLTARRDGMQTFTRGSAMGKWVPAQVDEGNAMAYEDDGWFDRLPILPNNPPQDMSGLGAVMSNDYAQQNGLGAILSNDYAQQVGVPNYHPTTTGEDPQAVAGTPYWEAPGTVGGAMRSQAGKTAAISGVGDYLQLDQLSGMGDWSDVANQVLAATANITSQSQLTSINRERIKQGLPPLDPSTALPGASRAQSAKRGLGSMTGIALVAAAVIGGAFWWSRRRKR